MAAPAAELRNAIFAALGADHALVAALGGPHLYDELPKTFSFPYVTFGRTSVYDWTTGSELDNEQLFTLHVWSKAKARPKRLISSRSCALASPASRCRSRAASRSGWRWNSPKRASTKTSPCITGCSGSGPSPSRRRRADLYPAVQETGIVAAAFLWVTPKGVK
jgi:hypothetical protein